MYNKILFEKKGKLAKIVLNHPASLNALSPAAVEELAVVLDEIEADREIRIAVITGTGKAFVAGADIKYMSDLTPIEAQTFSAETCEIYRKIESSRKIFIAAVNGFALGGGTELALACDIRIASTKAKFGLPEVSLGIIPGGGGTQRLPRLIGMARARELILTGEVIKAEKALEYGLVNAVAEPEELENAVCAMAEKILKNGPAAVSYAKLAMNTGAQLDLNHGIEYEQKLFGLCFAEKEQKEGMAAFIEKREPSF